MAPEFAVRRASADDLPEILEFHRTCQPELPRLHDGERWTWQFLEHPDETERPGYFVVDSGGQVAGTLGYIPLDFKVGGVSVTGSFPVDYFVRPDFRGLPALLLMKTVMGLRRITIESNYSDDARRLLDRLGFINIDRFVRNYHLPLSNGSSQWLKRAYRAAAPWVSAAVDRMAGDVGETSIASELDAEMLPSVPETDASIRIEKSYLYLRWRYGTGSGLRPVFVTQTRDNATGVLAILHENADSGAIQIMDIVKGRSCRLRPLVRALIDYGRQSGATSISAACADPDLGRALRNHGFGVSPSSVGLRAYTADKALRERLAVGDDWSFYLGDSDVS